MSIALESTGAAHTLTEDQAHAIGVDAYVYFYPLLLMDQTRKQLTNIYQNEFGKGPINVFVSVQAGPAGDFKGVVRFGMLYSPESVTLAGKWNPSPIEYGDPFAIATR